MFGSILVGKEELYINENIDEDKIPYASCYFSKESDSDEEKEFARKERIENNFTDENMIDAIYEINNSSEFIDSDFLPVIKHNEQVNESKMIHNNLETQSIFVEKYNQIIKNEQKAYTFHHYQVLKNQLSTQRTYEKNINQYQVSENLINHKKHKELEKFNELESNSKNLLHIINKNGSICLWKINGKYYYRNGVKGYIKEGTNDEVCSFISNSLKTSIKIVNNKSIVKNENVTNNKMYKSILDFHIPIIEDIVFNPKEDEFFEQDDLWYYNTFKHTKYLRKRL